MESNTHFLSRITKTDAAGQFGLQQRHRHDNCRQNNCFPRGGIDFRSHSMILAGKRQTNQKHDLGAKSGYFRQILRSYWDDPPFPPSRSGVIRKTDIFYICVSGHILGLTASPANGLSIAPLPEVSNVKFLTRAGGVRSVPQKVQHCWIFNPLVSSESPRSDVEWVIFCPFQSTTADFSADSSFCTPH